MWGLDCFGPEVLRVFKVSSLMVGLWFRVEGVKGIGFRLGTLIFRSISGQ